MKLKHTFTVFGLVAMLGLGVGVGLASRNAPAREVRADAGDTWYYRGTNTTRCASAWGAGTEAGKLIEGAKPVKWTFTEGEEFVFVPTTGSGDWNKLEVTRDGTAASSFTGSGTDNIACPSGGDFYITIVGTHVYFYESVYNEGDTLYFEINNDWKGKDSYSAYLFGMNSSGTAVNQSVAISTYAPAYSGTNTIYSVTLPATSNIITGLIFRGKVGDNEWNIQTYDLKFGYMNGKNYFKVNGTKDGEGHYDCDWLFREVDVADGAYLRGAWTDGWSTSGQRAMTTVTPGTQYSIEDVVLSADGEVKMVMYNKGEINWLQINTVAPTSGDFVITKVDDHAGGYNAKVSVGGSYDITVTKNNDAWDYEFVGSVDEDLVAAEEFCDDFEESMGLYCPIMGTDPSKGTEKLVQQWSTFKTRYLNDAQTSSTARGYLTDVGATGKIRNFQLRYDSILADYYSLLNANYNFLGRTVTPTGRTNQFTPITVSNDNTLVIIIVSASVATLLLVSGYFYLRKRKEDK